MLCLLLSFVVDIHVECYRRTHHLLKAILPENKEFVILLRKSPLQHALYRCDFTVYMKVSYYFGCDQTLTLFRNFVMYANNEISTGNTSVFNPLKAFAACSKVFCVMVAFINVYHLSLSRDIANVGSVGN